MTGREQKAWEGERRALALRMLDELGGTPEARRQVARVFDVTERSVRRWAARRRAGLPLVERRGRPPDAVPRERRQGVIRALLRLGPCAGVAALRGLFPDVAYRTLAKMKRRFARVIRQRKGWHQRRLRWLRPGAVWATDFTWPKASLERADDRLYLVRDLASGKQLAAVPCQGETARTTCAVLLCLFLLLGPPLVLKHDGGGAFLAKATQTLLQEHDVVSLRSPPRTPQYNGSCERSGGVLKQRIAHEACKAGHPDRWTLADIARALQLANTTARPFGATGPTPAEAFARRRSINAAERRAFKRTIDREITLALETRRSETGTMPTCSERAAIGRKAIQHALCKHGYLEIRRGRLSTPVSVWRAGIKA